MNSRGYLGPQHPVAAVVSRLCRAHIGDGSASRFIGGVGCGKCWERAIRDDERAVVLFGLPRELERDPDLVDEVAVDLACAGEPVSLTAAELVEAVRRLTARGASARKVAERLGMAAREVTRARARARRRSIETSAAAGGEEAA